MPFQAAPPAPPPPGPLRRAAVDPGNGRVRLPGEDQQARGALQDLPLQDQPEEQEEGPGHGGEPLGGVLAAGARLGNEGVEKGLLGKVLFYCYKTSLVYQKKSI